MLTDTKELNIKIQFYNSIYIFATCRCKLFIFQTLTVESNKIIVGDMKGLRHRAAKILKYLKN